MGSIIRRLVKIGARVVYNARRWTSMLRRLFPSSVTIASFSPERHLKSWRRYEAIESGKRNVSSNCPNWSDRHFFLRVLIGISYDLRTFGIPRAFSDGIRPGNAVQHPLVVKLMHYSGLFEARINITRR